MIFEKHTKLKSIINSSQGIHLTAYLENTGDLNSLKLQLRDAISKAECEIQAVLSPAELSSFLQPLRQLVGSDELLNRFKHNIGIFRTSSSFRVIALPIEVENDCVVASSFHVKPLLRWMRVDKDFLLLGIENKAAHLFLGSQHSLRRVDTLCVPDGFLKLHSKPQYTHGASRSVLNAEGIEALVDWICSFTRVSKPKLFMSGEAQVLNTLKRILPYSNLVKPILSPSFSLEKVSSLCTEIRGKMEVEALSSLEQVMSELQFAEERRTARKNIFQIATAVANGRVLKLLVADGVKLFGKFNSKTGDLKIHPRDLNHDDDDILDDLAQTVLAKGGEVIVTSRDEMPGGHLAWALLDSPSSELSQILEIRKSFRFNEMRTAV